MKKLLFAIILLVSGNMCYGNEWVPYVYHSPIVVNNQIPVIQNYPVVPAPVQYYVPIAPVTFYYVPVTTYQNVLVEQKLWCFHKKYTIASVPQTIYVPVKY